MKFTKHDDIYPSLLKQIYNPPQQLYYKGKIDLLKKTCVSIIGTRRFSQYGKHLTEKIVEEISTLDIAIVSGFAKGIDTIAHKAAIKNKIPTIAVLGSGIDNIYPKENEELAKRMIDKNLILSEYDGMEEPKAINFPQRNRIVSGLSIATIVIEAPEKSGALITARMALDQGREIFVIPGDVDRQNSMGILRLLQKGGAYPVSSGHEIAEVLKQQPHLFHFNDCIPLQKLKKTEKQEKPQVDLKLSKDESLIFNLIPRRGGSSLDEITKKTGLNPSTALSNLSLMEIKDLIKTKDGKYLRK